MSDVTWQEMGAFKKKLREMDIDHGKTFKPDNKEHKKKRPRPYVPDAKDVKAPDWLTAEPGTHPFKPLRPPGR